VPAPTPASASAAPALAPDVARDLPFAENAEPPLSGDVVKITLDGDHVLVDGAVAGSVKPIEALGRIQRVDTEFDALKAKREAWKAAHAGEPFPGVALLEMPAATKAVVVKSVFQTAAFSGYPNLAFAVRTAGGVARINADAQVPGPPTPENIAGMHPPELRLFVSITPGQPVVLTWKKEQEVISVVELPWADAFADSGRDVRAPGLAAKLAAEWSAQGQHRDPTDKKLDQAVVSVANAAELRHLVAALDAIDSVKRNFGGAKVPAFNATFSVR
jgi:hypothetical protein